MIEVQCQLMICRGHIRASMGTFQIFFWLMDLRQIDILVKFCTLVFISSQILKGCKWVWRSTVLSGLNLNMVHWNQVQKWEIFLLEGHRHKKDVLFWGQNIKVPFGIGHLHLHMKPNLYVCRRVQGSQIFKQNWIILIHSRFIVILLIWVSSALGWGKWVGVSRVTNYSLYEFRSIQR